MSLNKEHLGQIAYLARLSVSDEQIENNSKDLNNILSLVDQLSEVDTNNIEPMAHPLHMSQRLREDIVTEVDNSDAYQAVAPKTGNKHYLVPTVIE